MKNLNKKVIFYLEGECLLSNPGLFRPGQDLSLAESVFGQSAQENMGQAEASDTTTDPSTNKLSYCGDKNT
jgi:hypothetical protein